MANSAARTRRSASRLRAIALSQLIVSVCPTLKLLAAGSSLVVQPAAGFPALAKENRARLVIVNNRATPLDRLADAVIRGDITTVFREMDRLLQGYI
jgi:NAD-dependent SIR2 family protein deacetylase